MGVCLRLHPPPTLTPGRWRALLWVDTVTRPRYHVAAAGPAGATLALPGKAGLHLAVAHRLCSHPAGRTWSQRHTQEQRGSMVLGDDPVLHREREESDPGSAAICASQKRNAKHQWPLKGVQHPIIREAH